MTKVNAQNWSILDFLINNFYEIVEYKRGRGIYGDRVILKRSRMAECVFGEPNKMYEFYYMDANAVKELNRTVLERIKIIVRFICSSDSMNVLCDFDNSNGVDPTDWAMETKNLIEQANTINFTTLNDILVEQYKKLGGNFLSKLKKHREKQYFLASSDGFYFITKEYADEQIVRL
ncbi:MAG: hypothetical protein ACLRFL_02600 [Clostridia bacterium]